jgi:hypothetical protein
VNKVIEEFRVGTDTLLCPQCGEPNPIEDEKCFNCGTELTKPASLWQNTIDVIIAPFRGMQRVAATMPYWQGVFLYFLLISAVVLAQVWSVLGWGQAVVDNKIQVSRLKQTQVINDRNGEMPLLDAQKNALQNSTDLKIKLTDEQLNQLNDKNDQRIRLNEDQYLFLRDNSNADIKLKDEQIQYHKPREDQIPRVDTGFIFPFLLNGLIRITFSGGFAMALWVVARLFYKDLARTNFKSLFAVALFAQVNLLILIVLYILPVFVTDLLPLLHDQGAVSADNPNIYALLVNFLPLLYQLGLLIIGTKFSLKISWNRAALVVLLPALLLRIFLQLPF